MAGKSSGKSGNTKMSTPKPAMKMSMAIPKPMMKKMGATKKGC